MKSIFVLKEKIETTLEFMCIMDTMEKFKSTLAYSNLMLFSERSNLLVYGLSVFCLVMQFQYGLYSYIPITFLAAICLIKINNIKNASNLIEDKPRTITSVQFKYLMDKLPVDSDNYNRVIKTAYYNSRLDWLDLILKKYKKEYPEAIKFNLEITLQFILWGGMEAYQVLTQNKVFINESGYLNKNYVKKLFTMYAYDEKYQELLEIFKDLKEIDNDILKWLQNIDFNKDLKVVLNRLDLDLTLRDSNKPLGSVPKI